MSGALAFDILDYLRENPGASIGSIAQDLDIRHNGYCVTERENHLTMKQIAVPLSLPDTGTQFALGCYLPLSFEPINDLTDAMLTKASSLNLAI